MGATGSRLLSGTSQYVLNLEKRLGNSKSLQYIYIVLIIFKKKKETFFIFQNKSAVSSRGGCACIQLWF